MAKFLEVMPVLEPFLRKHRVLYNMERKLMYDWVAYYWNRDTISYMIDDSGKARAVCMIKLFRNLRQFLEPFVHDPCGRFVMIELLVANDTESMGVVFDELVGLWGANDIVIWDRGVRTENKHPRMMRWDQFDTLARRILKRTENGKFQDT